MSSRVHTHWSLGGKLLPAFPVCKQPALNLPGGPWLGLARGQPATCLPGPGVRGRTLSSEGRKGSILLSPLNAVTSIVAARRNCLGDRARVPCSRLVSVSHCFWSPPPTLCLPLKCSQQNFLLQVFPEHLRCASIVLGGCSKNETGWGKNGLLSSLDRTTLSAAGVSVFLPPSVPVPSRPPQPPAGPTAGWL